MASLAPRPEECCSSARIAQAQIIGPWRFGRCKTHNAALSREREAMPIIKTKTGYAVEEFGELIEFASLEAALAYVNAITLDLNNLILENYGS